MALFGTDDADPLDYRETVSIPRSVQRLRLALLFLDADERALIHGRYWDGFTFGELAASLGMDKRAVERSLDRALQKLREIVLLDPEPIGVQP